MGQWEVRDVDVSISDLLLLGDVKHVDNGAEEVLIAEHGSLGVLLCPAGVTNREDIGSLDKLMVDILPIDIVPRFQEEFIVRKQIDLVYAA